GGDHCPIRRPFGGLDKKLARGPKLGVDKRWPLSGVLQQLAQASGRVRHCPYVEIQHARHLNAGQQFTL
ncbi:hypothetical protein Moror_14779, partial [Moniliophthora roreri MCA 2997]